MNNKSKNLPFSLSKNLIAENFKLYWTTPFLTFLGYFFVFIFPIMLGIKENASTILDYTRFTLYMSSPLPWVLATIFSLMTALRMTNYIHKPNTCLAFVSQPYSRGKLFGSHVFTGYLMLIIPILIISLMYLGYYPTLHSFNLYGQIDKMLIFKWMVYMLTLTTFNYGLFTLASYLAGNTIISFLLSGVMYFIVPVVCLTIDGYASTFIVGHYKTPEFVTTLIQRANPVFSIISDDTFRVSPLYFFILGIIFILLAMIVFRYTKLEKVGDSLLSNVTEHIVVVLLVFEGMAISGIVANYLGKSIFSCIIGLLAGLFFTFFIVKLIIDRSLKIVTKKNGILLGSCLIICFLFTLFFVFDITGASKKIPSVDSIQGIDVNNLVQSVGSKIEINDDALLSDDEKENKLNKAYTPDPNSFYIKDDVELIKNVVSLHKLIIQKDYIINNNYVYDNSYTSIQNYEKNNDDGFIPYETITLDYKLKNGATFSRRYEVKLDKEMIDAIDKVVSSKGYQEQFRISDKIREAVKCITFSITRLKNGNTVEGVVNITDRKKINEIFDLCEKNITNINYKNILKEDYEIGAWLKSGEIYAAIPKDSKEPINPIGYISIYDTDKDFIKYLNSIGLNSDSYNHTDNY